MVTVQGYLQQRNVACKEYQHSPAYTAIARAEALVRMHSVDPLDVVKVLLLRAGRFRSKWSLVIIPAGRRLNMYTASQSVGRECRLATEQEIRKMFPWCSLGCLPALGGLLRIPQYIDPDVCQRQVIIFSAGEPAHSVEVSLDDLINVEPDVAVKALCRVAI
ncbi:YbaK/EbsC family protein [Streptomyces sp. NBC_01443]|uniref:YbaK/EbsC family protein n=1 Tax=Streptomyces sp. NBC_01443 TaxID=2903868 RepID=UPI00338F73A7